MRRRLLPTLSREQVSVLDHLSGLPAGQWSQAWIGFGMYDRGRSAASPTMDRLRAAELVERRVSRVGEAGLLFELSWRLTPWGREVLSRLDVERARRFRDREARRCR